MSSDLLERCQRAAAIEIDPQAQPDDLIGFFQSFRPDGNGLEGLFDDLPLGDLLHQRLAELFSAAGDDRRPTGGRDVYFIVRNPPEVEPDQVQRWGEEWLKNLRALAMSTPAQDAAKRLTPLPTIRVLEGIPPKHPKQDHEKSGLLKAFQDSLVDLTRQLRSSHTAGQLLRPAYYFTGCDPFLRDYLMWPLFRTATGMEDPFRPYFQLWRHGVKYRVFQETQVDLYMPRR